MLRLVFPAKGQFLSGFFDGLLRRFGGRAVFSTQLKEESHESQARNVTRFFSSPFTAQYHRHINAAFWAAIGYGAEGSTNRPLSRVSGLIPRRPTDATARDQVRNRAMLSTTTNAAVNTKRSAQGDLTFEAAARDMHSTVHRVVRRGTNTATGAVTSQVSISLNSPTV